MTRRTYVASATDAAPITIGSRSYSWQELSSSGGPDTYWSHHGVVATASDSVVIFDGAERRLEELRLDGTLVRASAAPVVEAHGLACGSRPHDDLVWVADPGFSLGRDGAYGVKEEAPGRVVALGLDGRIATELPEPPAHVGAPPYRPTSVAVLARDDGTESVWVSDGYGRHLVHRIGANGELELTLTGEEGAGRFDCPHTVYVDRRRNEPRIYVTDRGNSRIQVFTDDGLFVRSVTEGLEMPSNIARLGEFLLVADLKAKLLVLDQNDDVVGVFGDDAVALEREGWPNQVVDGETSRPMDLRAGRFNSPHGLTVTTGGAIVIAEWVIGGRIIVLHPEP